MNERPVAPPPEAIAALDQLCGPIPETPADPDAVLALLEKYGSPATVANGGGRYFGFVNGGCVPAALAAGWMVNAWDQNAAMHVQSPAAVAQLEETAIDVGPPASGPAGRHRRCGDDRRHHGQLLRDWPLQRHALLERAGWDVEE